ncbi:hypothetical protein [Saccharopolyspora shandongensis]|uniref:hypothetical protein n=1 Tax=Saccharopolyspora shandongensis TaxID=418495 RepID=UPI0033CF2474
MITTDVVRSVLYASIPAAWLLGVLTMPQLCAVALLGGIATVFSEVAAQSFLPDVVGRAHLVRANARLMGMRGVNQIVGQSVGGLLVSVLTAPVTIAFDAISYFAGCFVPMLGSGSLLWPAAVAWALIAAKTGIGNVLAVSLRQAVTPDHLMGRMNATFRFLLTGALAVASVLAGVLGELVGVRAVLWVSAGAFAVSWLVVFLSPLRFLRELPAEHGNRL